MATPLYAPYDALPVAALVLEGTRVIYANRACEQVTGLKVEELQGQDSATLVGLTVSEHDRRWVLKVVQRLARGEEVRAETFLRLSPRGGEERPTRIVTLPGMAPAHRVVLIFDSEEEVTHRRLVEAMVSAALHFVRCRDEQEVLEAAADAIYRQGYWVAVMQWHGRKARPAALRQDPRMISDAEALAGTDAAQMEYDADAVPYLDRLYAQRRAIFTQDIHEVMDQAQPREVARMMRETMPPIRMVDSPIWIGDAPYGWLSVQGTQLTPASAATVELFSQLIAGAMENVRHHHQAEERLKELSGLQAELVARERLAALGQAAGVLSHEARNPLGAILNALSVLRRSAALSPQNHEVLDIAEEEAYRLDALVRDLLELARPLEAKVRPVNLGAIFDSAASDLGRRMGRSAPAFELSAPEALPEILADATLLRVAVENLLRNAGQVSSAGKVKVTLFREGDHAVFSVDDALPVPDARHPEDGFDPFSIVRPRGTGLGLAVVKRVVEAQGGTVRARNGGARIELVLPLSQNGRGG